MSFLTKLFSRRSNNKQTSVARAWKTQLGVENLEERMVPAVIIPHVSAPIMSVTALSPSQAKLSWTIEPGAAGYQIDEMFNGQWQEVTLLNSSTSSTQFINLTPGNTYTFDVAAYNSVSYAWASVHTITMPPMSITVDHPDSKTTSYSNVTGSLFAASGPSYLDVRQGQEGDCWLLSSLAAVAARDPQDITNMFTYDGTAVENGTTVGVYTVRFFDSHNTARFVTVDTELPNGGQLYDQPVNGVLWVALAEKAYVQANGDRDVTSGSIGTDSYSALNEGQPIWALQAIMGSAASSSSINPTNIGAAWNAGEPIVLTSSATHASPYIVGSPKEGVHAYAVVNVNASSSMPYEVFNPWGITSSSNYMAPGTFDGHAVYGLFTANAPFISQNFSYQAFGGSAAGAQDSTHTEQTTRVSVEDQTPTQSAAPFHAATDALQQMAWVDDLVLALATSTPADLGSSDLV